MKNITTFLQEVRAELSRVIWPTRKEFIISTMVALLVILLFTLFLGSVNYLFYTAAQKSFKALVFGY